MIIYILTVIVGVLLAIIWYLLYRKTEESYYHIKIKFAHNLKTKLVLNAEQYEQFKAFLNQSDGHFEIGDENDHVKLYREFICAVEVKKK